MVWLNLFPLLITIFSGNSPSDFVWKNRLLIYDGNQDCSEWLSEDEQKNLTDRKLLFFHFSNGRLMHTNYTGEIHVQDFVNHLKRVKSQNENWILIGLDGGIKSTGDFPPNPSKIYRLIDAMPVRQSEIRGRKSGFPF
ncbi:uncharacterized protein DUF4174 [Algoriphagus aquaeductus]|uniref:Uncharacterized protein DUF4174 n=1 Tax=Algoriphagus aquaeductus TaxID=475299 RepID=A0A326RZ78_9BACT|nr:DUF4174 domain-containing protein [Algoriphagus aquaeductus]PZV82159.1 uncharacterized protein DUF4174 [Algoriphagus aquaeductus]